MMIRSALAIALVATLSAGLGTARADEAYGDYGEVAPTAIQPSGAAPAMTPPPPAYAGAQARPDGQWVYTSQYGWIWMPYGNQYVNEGTASGGNPYAYVYYPSYGWQWVVAPWVWGFGPYPYFGVRGALGFGWYRTLGHGGWGGARGWGYAHGGGRPWAVGPRFGGGYHVAARGGFAGPRFGGGMRAGYAGHSGFGGPRFGGGQAGFVGHNLGHNVGHSFGGHGFVGGRGGFGGGHGGFGGGRGGGHR